MRFYKCDICGKIVAMVKSTDVDTVCCGQPMRELVPGTTDGAKEKHVPVYTVCGSTVTVKVGSAEHPMTDAHRIEWIAIETELLVAENVAVRVGRDRGGKGENGNQRKELKTGEKPEATFALVPYDKVKSVYEYCNLHGLWKA